MENLPQFPHLGGSSTETNSVVIRLQAPYIKAATAMTFQSSEQRLWLFSRRADFWFACGGASVGVLAAVLLIFFHGDRELDALDLVLSEFHLGATYDAILRRRLWRYRRV